MRVELKRALSMPAFISCVNDALREHPRQAIRRAAARELEVLERETRIRSQACQGLCPPGSGQSTDVSEMLHAQLRSLSRLASHVVVCFDEFQRLNRCPGEPLAIIGSAPLGAASGNVSLLTGSIREYLEMMLNNSREPLFNQATKMRLPAITRAEFHEFLAFQFDVTSRTISERALDHLLAITESHPKRTQQLPWATWQRGSRRGLEVDDVREAFEELIDDEQADFAVIEETLANGEEAEATERKALYLLADHAGEGMRAAP